MTPRAMAEADARAPVPVEELIERAGCHVARIARRMLGGVYGRRVGVLAGPGNNGADAIVAARILQRLGIRVQVVAVGSGERLAPCDLVIDGAFGTGVNRPVALPVFPATTPVLAIDTPSGVDGLTGELHGHVNAATVTVTFAALKPGLLLLPGAEFTGDVEVADIGLDLGPVHAWLYTRDDAVRDRPRRHRGAHKWQRAVLVIGGSPAMAGAPLLASAAALRAEAGLVRCLVPAGGDAVGAGLTELIVESVARGDWANDALRDIDRFGAVVVGPGLEADDATAAQVQQLLHRLPPTMPVVVDGTALRHLDGSRLRPSIVLTPHDGEFESVTGARPGPDRFDAARRAAAATGATVLLKGPLTIIASPDGTCIAMNHGDARLATAGSGDVLSGAIAAALTAGLEPSRAAAYGSWIHADAATEAFSAGVIASDLMAGLAHSVSALANHQETADATN